MPQAAQSTRTFFVSSTTAGRRALLQSDRMAHLLVDVLAENRQKRRFLLHDFVIIPNHFHLLLTPAADIPLEKALQLIKGGFSYRAKREVHFAFEIWTEFRKSPTHRITTTTTSTLGRIPSERA
jgi:putative transposase